MTNRSPRNSTRNSAMSTRRTTVVLTMETLAKDVKPYDRDDRSHDRNHTEIAEHDAQHQEQPDDENAEHSFNDAFNATRHFGAERRRQGRPHEHLHHSPASPPLPEHATPMGK